MARPPVSRRVEKAFDRGVGHGLLQLGAGELTTELPPAFSFFRRLGQLYLTQLCAVADLEEMRHRALRIAPPDDELGRLAAAVPPLQGAEYLTVERLREAWALIEEALEAELAEFDGTVQQFLQRRSAAWNVVGRICLHLAENKRDPDFPFAFLATQAVRVTGQGSIQHQPLGKALAASQASGDRRRLLSLLVPVKRAAEESALVRELLESKAFFRTQRWSPAQAHRFLKEVPLLESKGLVVRVPDSWARKHPPRPKVRVSLGSETESRLGADALLDFSVGLSLDGEPLTGEEIEAILSASEGLVLIRGKWVEADQEVLGDVLEQWKKAQQLFEQEGVPFAEAMRLLAGATLDGGEDEEERRRWSEVVAADGLREALERLRDPQALDSALPSDAELRATLRPYQRTGVSWLWHLFHLGLGGCLADDMGLGKTIQVLSLLLMLRRQGRRPSLLVLPASLVANWSAEIERFTPTLASVVLHPSAMAPTELAKLDTGEALRERLGQADVALTTYGMLRRMKALAQVDWELVVLDEAQAIKNPSSQQTRAAKKLEAPVRLALTGTPVENRLGDLWSIFDFLNPGLLGSTRQFSELTRRLGKGNDEGFAPLRRLVRPYILRRMKTDRSIIADLPDKTEIRAFCGLSKTQAVLYQQAVQELEHQLTQVDEQGMKRRGVVLAALMRFKQICNHPSQWLADEGWAPEDSGKFRRLAEICEEIASRQEKVLVFTQFRQLTSPLSAFLAEVFGAAGAVLHGGTPVRRRQSLVEEFQRDDGPPFFVVSLKAGGTGLNLTAASQVIHFDRWWNPAVEHQATDRAFRIGQKRNVLVHKFVCRGTIEERIDQTITAKEELADGVLQDNGEAVFTELDNDELLQMVQLDIDSARVEAV